MTDRFNSANLEVKREPDMQGVGSNSPSSTSVQVKNERLNGYPDDGGKFFNKIEKNCENALGAVVCHSPCDKYHPIFCIFKFFSITRPRRSEQFCKQNTISKYDLLNRPHLAKKTIFEET